MILCVEIENRSGVALLCLAVCVNKRKQKKAVKNTSEPGKYLALFGIFGGQFRDQQVSIVFVATARHQYRGCDRL
jgi:hypothetical protein